MALSGPQLITLQDDGIFPNSQFPVLLYKNVAQGTSEELFQKFKAAFSQNNWSNSWKAGIFTYNHYHSITHEVIGVCQGHTILQLGGEHGERVAIEKGDILVIPAGVAHKNLMEENQVTCIGAYPDGKDYDMNYGKPGERPQTDKNIAGVPLPKTDPILGASEGLVKSWKRYSNQK